MNKKRVLVIDAGGTLAQKPGPTGSLRLSEEEYFSRITDIQLAADVETLQLKRVDSTNLTTENRAETARIIHRRYREFDGFVVAQGTDTLADSASALHYMLQGLGKPVILTGAQLPIFAPGPDGRNNLYYSIKAATENLGEVAICFGDRILRGVRSVKYNVHSFNAFRSPGTAPLAELGTSIRWLPHRIPRNEAQEPVLFTDFNTRILRWGPISGGTADPLLDWAGSGHLAGLILEGFGAGHIPRDLHSSLTKLTRTGVPVILITTCTRGGTQPELYEVGRQTLETGIIPAGDLTREAAGQKLMYGLGKIRQQGLSGNEALRWLQKLFSTSVGGDREED